MKRVLIIGLALFLAAGGFFGWRLYKTVFGPGPRFDNGDRILLIPTGSTYEQVVESLKQSGVVEDEKTFDLLAKRKKYASKVKPGRYRLPSGTSLNDLLNKLRSGEQEPVRITFTNIRTLPQLAGQVSKYIEADSLALIEVMRDQATIDRLGFRSETMMCLFVPNTYEFWWTTKPEEFLERMSKEYKRYWTEDRKAKAKRIELSQSEVSTLASIVQAETAKPEEAPIIAAVYLNRLRIGMALQADPTLKFALGMDSLTRILTKDLEIDSPYNTYTHVGLPPGPINMPEPRYIDAVLNAQKNDYLYFCARETLDGYSNFAKTYEQHLVNARRYQRALNERGIYR
ncbi:MAG: endolytic transglycosylase MltG [Flavobacteriales bacterium]|nr:endolytic transglycosylase MltG [Flavobacteriales bacterium]